MYRVILLLVKHRQVINKKYQLIKSTLGNYYNNIATTFLLPQLGRNMNTTQATSANSLKSSALFSVSTTRSDYFWKNLVIEKRISVNWLYKLYKGSLLYSFWSVFSSPVN